jgi:hypothetical protein
LPATPPLRIGRNFPCKSILLPFLRSRTFIPTDEPLLLSLTQLPAQRIYSLLCWDVVKFVVLKFYLLAGLIFVCLSCSTVRPQIAPERALSPAAFETLHPTDFSQGDGILKPIMPSGNAVVLNFGPQLLELKASYLERRDQISDLNNMLPDGTARRYLNLLATSSFGGSGLIGESEISYSSLNSLPKQCACKDWPKMLRLGLKSGWGGLSYGANYKSTDRGFVSITGVTTDQTRDEGELWGERTFGPFSIRGSMGESWEKLLDTNVLSVTRSATASLNFNRPQWGAKLASSYGWVEQGPGLNQETTVFTNALAASYRPLSFLSVNPNFSIREERNPYTRIRTETPKTELVFAYTPLRDSFTLTGATSFTQTFNDDGLNNTRIFGSRAALDWKIGKFFGTDDTLSFNLNYNQQPDLISSASSHNDLSGMLQLKITGF